MRKLLITLLLLLPVQGLMAGTPPPRPHQVRVGWGDMLFETLAFPAAGKDKGGKGFTGHLFAGYQYSINRHFSVGGQLDFEGIYMADMNNYDLILMPTARVTYINTEWVELHSGLGVGVLFAFDNKGGKEFAPAIDLNLFGIQLGNGPLRMGLDIGMLNALINGKKVYMMGSRLVSISLNYQF